MFTPKKKTVKENDKESRSLTIELGVCVCQLIDTLAPYPSSSKIDVRWSTGYKPYTNEPKI